MKPEDLRRGDIICDPQGMLWNAEHIFPEKIVAVRRIDVFDLSGWETVDAYKLTRGQTQEAVIVGMFDYIRCEARLPGEQVPENTVFQTKDLDGTLTEYTISADGALLKGGSLIHFFGEIRFYTEGAGAWLEYTARFSNGKLQGIEATKTLNLGTPVSVVDTPSKP